MESSTDNEFPKPSCKGADIFARTLQAMGVNKVFCYPGGANLELLDALSRVAIDLVRTEHEQGAVFAAQGYARASGRLGICLATSGPGATNMVTGIADANSDSIPIMAITGNVSSRWLGKNAFQEVDIVAITAPVTKSSQQINTVVDIAPTLMRAAKLALYGRPGPVLIDIPKDIQQADGSSCEPNYTGMPAIDEPNPEIPGDEIRVADLTHLNTILKRARRPVIYAGGGIIAAAASAQLLLLAESLRCPVVLTLMGLGAMDIAHPFCLGPVGMHGAWRANVAVNEADLVLALGVRFDDRVIGDPAAFAQSATIVHIDIDARELGKNKLIQLAIVADLRIAMKQMLSIAVPLETVEWLKYLDSTAAAHPLTAPAVERLSGPQAISKLGAKLRSGDIVTTGVGQHQMWAMQYLRPNGARTFLSSSGFGTMGFGLPAAIGAKSALPKATVVDIDGDGSLNMTINELSTCHRYGLGVKVFVVNNQWLGMVRQWQDLIYHGNRVVSSLQVAGENQTGLPYPDFLAIAGGYGIKAERVDSLAQLDAALERMLADPQEPYLLDVLVEREDEVLPMIPSGKSYRDTIFSSADGVVSDT